MSSLTKGTVKVDIRRDTASNFTTANPTLKAGEPAYETDTQKLKVGDGSTQWTSLAYVTDVSLPLAGGTVTGDVIFDSATTEKPLITLENRTNDQTGSHIKFLKDKGAAGAASDVLGSIDFYGDDAGQAEEQFARIQAQVDVATDGQESGILSIAVASHDGELQNGILMRGGGTEDEVDVNIGGTTSSTTQIAGALTVGSDITLDDDKKVIFGDAGEYIVGDGTDLDIVSSETMTLTPGVDMILDAGRHITLRTATTGQIYFDSEVGIFNFRDASDTNDAFKITVQGGTGGGTTTLETVSDGADGHLSVVADGTIKLNSPAGGFEMHGGGTTAKFADMYAGMILGYTVIGDNATPASYTVTDAMIPVHDDLKVSFVFPPSGKVEIMASIFIQTVSGRMLTFGLSTTNNTSGFASLGAQYENNTYVGDETDSEQHTHRWYITGTAGDSETLWFSAGCNYSGTRYHLRWGGDSSAVADGSHPTEYQPFIMKATALPATVYTG